ncbi:MAG: hypothetical protein PSN36_06630 [Gammaproteobacteria bacterium]|nr:hypothetical protein [Gammaproteobacteria bacterium]
MEGKQYSSFNNELDIMNDYIYITPEKLYKGVGVRLPHLTGHQTDILRTIFIF